MRTEVNTFRWNEIFLWVWENTYHEPDPVLNSLHICKVKWYLSVWVLWEENFLMTRSAMLKKSKPTWEVELYYNTPEQRFCITFVIKRGQCHPKSLVVSSVQLFLFRPFCFFPLAEFYEVSSPISSNGSKLERYYVLFSWQITVPCMSVLGWILI